MKKRAFDEDEDEDEDEDREEKDYEARKRRENEAFKLYRMAFVGTLIPKALYVGEMPTKPMDIRYLQERLGVTHIVNILPETDQKTPKGLNKSSWYTCFFSKKGPAPKLVRIPLPENGLAELNEKKQIALLNKHARTVSDLLRTKGTAVYIHGKTGKDEEALIAFIAWNMLGTAPANLEEWLQEKSLDRLVENELDKILLKKCVAFVKTAAPLTNWLKNKK